MFSLDLSSVGTFTNQMRSGYQNLGKQSIEKAKERELEYIPKLKAYRLKTDERIRRVQTLLYGMGRIEGGAKQALHYTPVSPVFVLATVTRGGNNLFGHVIKHNRATGEAELNEAALRQVFETFKDDILSPIYVGRAEGFMDSAQTVFDNLGWGRVQHPRQVLDSLANDLAQNSSWMD
jgi:CRISPR-associated protein Cst2